MLTSSRVGGNETQGRASWRDAPLKRLAMWLSEKLWAWAYGRCSQCGDLANVRTNWDGKLYCFECMYKDDI